MKKINNYFSHDFNARNDIKLKKLNMIMGLEGLGLYWCIIECLYENNGYMSFDDIDLLSYELRIEKEKIEKLIKEFDLFKTKNKSFYSQSVLNRLEKINEKSEKARKSVQKRWEKQNTNDLLEENESNTNVSQTNYYIKEKKIKENKRNENKNNILTTTDNIYSFIESNFGRTLSPIEYEKISLWLSDYKEEFIKEAIQISIMNRKCTFAYVEGILKNWKAKGFETLDEIKEDNLKGFAIKHTTDHIDSSIDIDKEIFDYNWLEDDEHE